MIIDELIYDRTQVDVDRMLLLKSKWLDGTISADEQTEWMAGMRGAYNYTDLNRVGNAVDYVANALLQAAQDVADYRAALGVGYDPYLDMPYNPAMIVVNPKTDWTVADIPTVLQMQTYVDDLFTLRGAVPVPADTPSLPYTMDYLTYNIANAIERNIKVVYEQIAVIKADVMSRITKAAKSMVYSAEFYAGEVN